MGNVIYLEDFEDTCIDSLVEEWNGAIAFKIFEIDKELGRECAYQFYSRVCNHDLDKARLVVDLYLEDPELDITF